VHCCPFKKFHLRLLPSRACQSEKEHGSLGIGWSRPNSLLGVHFQIMESLTSSLRHTFLRSDHISMNSTSSCLEEMWQTATIQFLFACSLATVLFLKHALLKRFGAWSLRMIPFSHLSCQNEAFLPFPSFNSVEA
jgi:hypothetical protein